MRINFAENKYPLTQSLFSIDDVLVQAIITLTAA